MLDGLPSGTPPFPRFLHVQLLESCRAVHECVEQFKLGLSKRFSAGSRRLRPLNELRRASHSQSLKRIETCLPFTESVRDNVTKSGRMPDECHTRFLDFLPRSRKLTTEETI